MVTWLPSGEGVGARSIPGLQSRRLQRLLTPKVQAWYQIQGFCHIGFAPVWKPQGKLFAHSRQGYRKPCTYLRLRRRDHIFLQGLAKQKRRKGSFGEPLLSTLQSGNRNRTQIRRGLHVCADCRSQAAAKIRGSKNLLLPAMLGVVGHGASAGGCPQRCRLDDDSRTGRRRSCPDRSGMGRPAGCGRPAA